MKKLYLLLSLLSMQAMAFAAEGEGDGPLSLTTGVVISGGGFPHFTPQLGIGSGASQKYFRLVGKTYTKHNGSWFLIQDSTSYKYNSDRGGLVNADMPNNDENILFDEATTYYFNESSFSYQNRLQRKQLFDNENRIQTLKYAFWHTASQAWKDSCKYTYSYLPGTNKIDISLFQLWVGGTWSHDLPSKLTYNGNNVTNVSSLDYSATYIYDANNNIITIEDRTAIHGSGSLNNNERKTYTYTPGNEVNSYTLAKWDAGSSAWVNSKRWEYTYTGKNITTSVEYNWNGGSWGQYATHEFTYDSKGNQLTEIIELWDGTAYVNSTLETRVYNQYDLLESITTAEWDHGTWAYKTNNTQTRYYYEYYTPTSISSTYTGTDAMRLFPVPANDVVNVQFNWNSPQASTLRIFNMTGACVYQSSEPASLNFSKSLDVASLTAGTYTIQAQGEKDAYTGKLLINR